MTRSFTGMKIKHIGTVMDALVGLIQKDDFPLSEYFCLFTFFKYFTVGGAISWIKYLQTLIQQGNLCVLQFPSDVILC